jgi:Nucleoside phosphorylase
MPGIGRSPVASVASSLRISFTGVQLALVVGICGAAPYPSNRKQIFLGDVIISDSIVQYDFGRQYPGGFDRKKGVRDILGRPSQEIRALLNSLQRRRSLLEFKDETSQYLDFESSFAHKHYTSVLSSRCRCFDDVNTNAICTAASETPCEMLGCGDNRVLRRRSNQEDHTLSIHIGKVACADTVMKSAESRDKIVLSEEVLSFEMEGAGVWG